MFSWVLLCSSGQNGVVNEAKWGIPDYMTDKTIKDAKNEFLVGPDDDYDPNEGLDSPKNLDLKSKPDNNCVNISKEDPEDLVDILVNIYGCEEQNAKTHAYGLQDKLTTVKEAIEGLLRVVTFSEAGLQESTPTQELDSSDRAFDHPELDGTVPSREAGGMWR